MRRDDMVNTLGKIERISKKKYHDEIIDMFWDEFKHLNTSRFADIVKEILCNYRGNGLPTISDFIKLNSELRYKQYDQDKQHNIDEINRYMPPPIASSIQFSNVFKGCLEALKTGVAVNDSIYPKGPRPECPICNDTGNVHVKHKQKTYTYVFKCNCEQGQKDDSAFTTWKRDYLKIYDLIT